MSTPDISIVFPAYNEKNRLPRSLRLTKEFMSGTGHSFEIIVVDDGSTDGTPEYAREALASSGVDLRVLRHETNRGKGQAVRTGIDAATGKYVLFSDADLSTPIEELPGLLSHVDDGFDIAIGSRALDRERVEVRQAAGRDYSGRLFNVLVQALLLPGIHDTQCGFKLFVREIIPELTSRQKITGFSFDVELLWIARKLGFSIKEVPVRWLNDPETKVKFFSDGPKMILDLLRIRLIHRKTDFSATISDK